MCCDVLCGVAQMWSTVREVLICALGSMIGFAFSCPHHLSRLARRLRRVYSTTICQGETPKHRSNNQRTYGFRHENIRSVIMAVKRKCTQTEKALSILRKGAIIREDSDDELGIEDHPWEWIYDSSASAATKQTDTKHVVGAQMGSFQCRIGDAVLLKAAGNEAWVAIITGFSEGEAEDDNGEVVWGKKATFMWFSSEREMKKSARKRDDALPVRSVNTWYRKAWC